MDDDAEEVEPDPAASSSRRRLRSVDSIAATSAAGRPRRQDQSGFDTFFVDQAPGILALLITLTGDRGQAEDLTQEVFVKAYRDWARISGYDKPGAWVRRVAINAATSAGRRHGSEGRALRRVWSRAEREVSPDVAELADDSAKFWSVVRSLPRQQAAAIALYYLDDSPVAEIATALGCAEATARVHLHRGRLALAQLLDVEVLGEEAP